MHSHCPEKKMSWHPLLASAMGILERFVSRYEMLGILFFSAFLPLVALSYMGLVYVESIHQTNIERENARIQVIAKPVLK